MSTAARRSFILIEAFAFSAYVGLYMWRLQASTWSSWLVFPVWMLVSFIVHRDVPKTLGWRADNLWLATKRSTMVFLPCIVGLSVAGIVLGALHRPTHHLLLPNRFFGYMAFCLLQQAR